MIVNEVSLDDRIYCESFRHGELYFEQSIYEPHRPPNQLSKVQWLPALHHSSAVPLMSGTIVFRTKWKNVSANIVEAHSCVKGKFQTAKLFTIHPTVSSTIQWMDLKVHNTPSAVIKESYAKEEIYFPLVLDFLQCSHHTFFVESFRPFGPSATYIPSGATK